MKRIGLLVAIVAFALCLVSCGGSGPTADAKKMLKLTQDLTATINKAAEDKTIADDEAKKINDGLKEFFDFVKKVDEKYKDNEEAQIDFEEYLDTEENEKLGTAFEEAMGKLFECEGFEKISFEGFM